MDDVVIASKHSIIWRPWGGCNRIIKLFTHWLYGIIICNYNMVQLGGVFFYGHQ